MSAPLADRMRPETIQDVAGQHHLLDEGKVLHKIIASGRTPNMIFYGPSGVGKTTVANIIAKQSGKRLYYLNATTASTSDIKDIVKAAEDDHETGRVLLYLDEIQYFNKKQQQILLSHIENGEITLVASTTENPYFYVYPAILSRSITFEFKQLTIVDVSMALDRVISRAKDELNINIKMNPNAKLMLAQQSGGDMRKALNILDVLLITKADSGDIIITETDVNELAPLAGARYDRDGDQHYDVISAYQKSMRGSDPDAALHYLARLLDAGDLPSACRRLLVCANEDVGLAYPQIISIVKDAVDTAIMVGLPEARLPLANAVVLVATAPKSNSTHDAINAAMKDINNGYICDIPRHLQNKHYDGTGAEVAKQDYKYPHDYKNHYVAQQYLPDALCDKTYYRPGDNRFEQQIDEYWKKIKKK